MSKKKQVEKRKNTVPEQPTRKTVTLKKQPLLTRENILPALFILLYMLVDFIPRFGAGDIMGSQWFYLSLLNTVSILYLLFNRQRENNLTLSRVIFNPLSFLYLGLLVLVILSITWSINKTESLVVFARFANTIVMYFCMAIFLFSRLPLLKLFSQVMAVFLLIQSIDTLSDFYEGLGQQNLDRLIYYLKGNAGNKNILAASLVMKMAFTIYCIYVSSNWWKLINGGILLTGALAIFILNARASYLGLGLQLLLFITAAILVHYKTLSTRQIAMHALIPLLTVILAFFISQAMFKNAVALQEENTSYGTVAERLSTISFTAEGSNARLYQWKSALQYIQGNPLKGCGFGNWKLASIPYEKTFVDDMLVTYHVHNDFLEITAETGIAGGLLFIGLFLCVFIFSVKALLNKQASATTRAVSILTLMLLGSYSIDALFNFPSERPIMQFFFAFIMALGVNLYLSLRPSPGPATAVKPPTRIIFGLGALALLLPSLYITYNTYKSLVVQTLVNTDMGKPQLLTRWQDIIDAFPAIPNMNAYCYPIDHIKAIYLMEDKKYDQALSYINRSLHVNPYLTLSEYLKTKIFIATNNPDSAYYYAQVAFFNKPRSRANYELLNQVSIQRKDTAMLGRAFREYSGYRKDPWGWNRYLEIMLYMPNNQTELRALADSAIKLFPNDAALLQKQQQISGSQQTTGGMTAEQQSDFITTFNIALDLYAKGDYNNAITNFKKASALNPNDLISHENIGLSYFAISNFSAAIPHFDKVISAQATRDGKSEYYRGICLLNMGRKNEGCSSLQLSLNKNYPQAAAAITANCQ
ncbi:MAG TPA: O-antigen ligase family protein [Chitinophagaceae bacterium]|nr:O-antigen ligase family protein [Chitinophagaceae bacterium]